MNDKNQSERIVSLLEDIKKLLILSLYKREDVTSDDIAGILGLGGSAIRKMISVSKKNVKKVNE